MFFNKLTDYLNSSTTNKKSPTIEKTNKELEIYSLARTGNSEGLAQWLVDHPEAQVDRLNLAGWAPIHLAANSNSPEVIELLVRHGADVNLKNRSGNTALHIAIKSNVKCVSRNKENNIQAIQMLLDNNADISIRDEHKRTAVDLAIFWERLDLFDVFDIPAATSTKGLNESKARSVYSPCADLKSIDVVNGFSTSPRVSKGIHVPRPPSNLGYQLRVPASVQDRPAQRGGDNVDRPSSVKSRLVLSASSLNDDGQSLSEDSRQKSLPESHFPSFSPVSEDSHSDSDENLRNLRNSGQDDLRDTLLAVLEADIFGHNETAMTGLEGTFLGRNVSRGRSHGLIRQTGSKRLSNGEIVDTDSPSENSSVMENNPSDDEGKETTQKTNRNFDLNHIQTNGEVTVSGREVDKADDVIAVRNDQEDTFRSSELVMCEGVRGIKGEVAVQEVSAQRDLNDFKTDRDVPHAGTSPLKSDPVEQGDLGLQMDASNDDLRCEDEQSPTGDAPDGEGDVPKHSDEGSNGPIAIGGRVTLNEVTPGVGSQPPPIGRIVYNSHYPEVAQIERLRPPVRFSSIKGTDTSESTKRSTKRDRRRKNAVTNNDGITPESLQSLELQRHIENAKKILGNIPVVWRNPQRLLHTYAAKGEDDILAEILKQDKVDINSPDDQNRTAVQKALENKNWSTVTLLIEKGAMIAEEDSNKMGGCITCFLIRLKRWDLAKRVLQITNAHSFVTLDTALVSCNLDVKTESKVDTAKQNSAFEFLIYLVSELFHLPCHEGPERFAEAIFHIKLGKMEEKNECLQKQYRNLLYFCLLRKEDTIFRCIYYSMTESDQRATFENLCITLSDDLTVQLVAVIIHPVCVCTAEIAKDSGVYMEALHARALRCIRRTYGMNEDSILTFLATNKKTEGLSFMLTNPSAKQMVLKHSIYTTENNLKQNLLHVLLNQGSVLTKQKEEFLDLIRDKYEDRSDAINAIKSLIPTSQEGKELLESLTYRYPMTMKSKCSIFVNALLPFLLTSAFWLFDFTTDIIVTQDTWKCMTGSFNHSMNCTRLKVDEWRALTSLYTLHLVLPFFFFLLFGLLALTKLDSPRIHLYKLMKKSSTKSATLYVSWLIIHFFSMLIAPVVTKFIRMVLFIRYRLESPGEKKNLLHLDYSQASKSMVMIAVTEASMEANYQLYINFLLYFPYFVRLTLKLEGILQDTNMEDLDLAINSRSLAIFTSFASLVWTYSAFNVYIKRGALDFTSSPMTRIVLILMYGTEILGRLMIISIYFHSNLVNEKQGHVDWLGAVTMFYSHALICFIINITFNDSSIKKHYHQPVFYVEAIVNAFCSIFTYSNFTIFDPDHNREEHQPSFIRQVIFQFIFLVEFLYMLLSFLTHTPNEIIDENGERIQVTDSRKRIWLISVSCLYVFGILLRIVYYRMHPWMVKLIPSLQVRIFGVRYKLARTPGAVLGFLSRVEDESGWYASHARAHLARFNTRNHSSFYRPTKSRFEANEENIRIKILALLRDQDIENDRVFSSNITRQNSVTSI